MAKQRSKEELIEILIPAIVKSSGEPREVVRARLRAIDTMELFYMETKQRNAGLLPSEETIEATTKHREKIIAVIRDLQLSQWAEDGTAPADSDTTLAQRSLEELEATLIQLHRAKVNRLEEERDAESAEHEAERLRFAHEQKLRREEERERRLVQFEQQDRRTFREAARRYGFSEMAEANWNLLRSVLNPGFTSDQVGEVLRSGGVQLAEPTPAELETWERERITAHNERLLAMDPIELRKQAKLENVARTVQFEEEQDRREVEGTARRDATLGFPELPETNSSGESLDSKFFMKADAGVLRSYIKKYGAAQVTRAIRERI